MGFHHNAPCRAASRNVRVTGRQAPGAPLGSGSVDRFDLVIFDCDGVLVDSERLAVRVESEVCSALGWNLSESEIVDRFLGRSDAYMQAEVERHIGRAVDWENEFERRYREVFERELTPVEGVVEALDQIAVPVCVASSGSLEKLRFTLGLTDLYDRFAGRIFSGTEVSHPKPAPDVFLLAASRLGAEPGRSRGRGGQPIGRNGRRGGGDGGLRLRRRHDGGVETWSRRRDSLRRHAEVVGTAEQLRWAGLMGCGRRPGRFRQDFHAACKIQLVDSGDDRTERGESGT